MKILVELLSTLAAVTKQVEQGRSGESIRADALAHYLAQCKIVKFLKKLLGENDVEAILQRIDRLTLDEARTTAAQTLEAIYGLVQNMRIVMDGEQVLLRLSFTHLLILSRLDGKAMANDVKEALGTFGRQ